MLDAIVNEIIIASQLLHTNVVTKIAEEIGYKPILIINALYRGAETGKLTYDKKHDTITIAEDVAIDSLSTTDGMAELSEQIEVLIKYLNTEEIDMSIQEIQMLLGGTPELHVKIAVLTNHSLTTYELADPKDKESVYTFITLNENAEHKWGQRQFDTKKSRATKKRDKAVK